MVVHVTPSDQDNMLTAAGSIAAATAAGKASCFTVGQEVQRRNNGGQWDIGYVVSLDPLLVSAQKDASGQGSHWDEVEALSFKDAAQDTAISASPSGGYVTNGTTEAAVAPAPASTSGAPETLEPEVEPSSSSATSSSYASLRRASTYTSWRRAPVAQSNAGLHNLGNTCFMASSVACLANVPVLRDYFLSSRFKDSLRVKGLLTERTQGRFATGFYDLLSQIWDTRGCSSQAAPAKRFKSLIESLDSSRRFNGHRQHDSCEFIEFLVDGLKEDCNRVKGKKPYVERKDHNGRPDTEVALEAANDFVLRNDSFIDDLFVGFHKSVINCPDASCGRESIVFQPELSIKLELQNKATYGERTLAVTAVPTQRGGTVRHLVSLDKSGCNSDLVEIVAKQAGLSACNCILVDVYKGRAFKYLKDVNRIQDIADTDNIVLYELEDAQSFKMFDPDSRALSFGDRVLVTEDFESDSKKSVQLVRGMMGTVREVDETGDAKIEFPDCSRITWVFKAHFDNLINLDSDERKVAKDGERYTILEVQELERFDSVSDLLDLWKEMEPLTPTAACTVHFRQSPPFCDRVHNVGVPIFICSPRSTTIPRLRETVGTALAKLFGEESRSGWTLYEAPCNDEKSLRYAKDVIVPPGDGQDQQDGPLQLNERSFFIVEWSEGAPQKVIETLEEVTEARPPDNSVSLDTCFKWYTEPEQVSEQDEVYCSGCKAHRRVTKRLEMWSLPPVLVLQLKRFEFDPGGQVRRKLNTPVRFPLDGLDLTPFCGDTESFPEGECLRAGQTVEIHGLQSAAGQKLNGTVCTAMYWDSNSMRFCVRMQETDTSELYKKLQSSNLRPVSSAAKVKHPRVFDLCAISKHLAYADITSFGHYVSYARSSEDGLWRLFDDDDVKEVTADEVAAQRSGAYILFYLRRDLRPESWGPPADPVE